MNCPQCDTANPADAKFCFQCGAALASACPQCQAKLLPQAKFCSECGTRLGAYASESSQPEKDALAARFQRLVPKAYAERLLATRGSVGRERRTVTILFCDVQGSTAMAGGLDPEDWLAIMDGAFDLLTEPVYRYEGTVARLMGDAVLAFFGAPIAHEDDPERACRAALEIVAGAHGYAGKLERERRISGFDVRVGINTGLVVVGEVGSDLRVEYTAMGDAVNLAARMEQNAPPGGILMTHETYRFVRGVFDVLPQELLQVKGRPEPVQTYLVQRAKPRAFRKPSRGVAGVETRMVGREAELKHLQEAFYMMLEDGDLQMVTVCGEAGVGKSRLLHEFDLWSELVPEHFYYFKGRARSEMQSQPYGLLRDLIALRFQIEDSHRPETVREKLEAGFQVALGAHEDSQRCAHLLGYLVGFHFGYSPYLAGAEDDAEQFRDQALAGLSDYFRGMASQLPVLILLEDIHWSDGSSLDALSSLALSLAKVQVMIVCAARPALFENRPLWGEGQSYHSRLSLAPLSRWDSRRLVAEILQKVENVPQSLRDLVVAGAEGNPFFIEELIKMLVDDGLILVGEDRWDLDLGRLSEIRVPPTLTGVLQARLDRLPPGERTVLQQASIVGRLFWDQAVSRINQSTASGTAASGVVEGLAALRGRELVFQRETSSFSGAREYIFRHALLREITYQSLLKKERRVYHSLAADWLLEQGGERAGEFTALIAGHLARAGRTSEAVGYLQQAGDRARRLYAHQEAISAYERALALLEDQRDDEGAARTLMKLGLTFQNAADHQRAQDAYECGFALWQQLAAADHSAGLPSSVQNLRVYRPEPVTVDPVHAVDMSGAVVRQLFSGMLAETLGDSVVPDVAERWEVSDGGTRYLFRLRKDVLWSDGLPLTAHDFAYAWKRTLDPATGSRHADALDDIKGARAFRKSLVSNPEKVGMRAVNDYTLEIEFELPVCYALHLMALEMTLPVPRHVVQKHGPSWTEPGRMVCNGPFKLQAWEPGRSMTLSRNTRYHGRILGNVQQVELVFSARGPEHDVQSLYEADLLDIVQLDTMAPEEIRRLRQAYAGEYHRRPRDSVWYLIFDVNVPPFDQPRVRRALCQAVDREKLVQLSRGGLDLPATGGFVPPGMPGHCPGIALPYDPQQARKTLAEAGYPGGAGLDGLEMLASRTRHAEARFLLSQWQECLGFAVNLQLLDWASYLTRVRTSPPCLFFMGWVPDYSDPDSYLRVGLFRNSDWRHGRYEQLIEQARQAADHRLRMKLYAEAELLLAREAPILPLIYRRRHLLVKPWVKRFSVSAIGELAFQDVVIEPH